MAHSLRLWMCGFWNTLLFSHLVQLSHLAKADNIWITQPHIQRELRFVEVTNCVAPISEPSEKWPQTHMPRQLLHCPSGAFVHIVEAVIGQTFTTDSPCLDTHNRGGNEDTPVPDPAQRFICAPKIITSTVQQICEGMNTCDIVRKLIRIDAAFECRKTALLRVNYTCFPVYSQQEIICADSYVELSCSTFGNEATLLLLRAQFGLPTTVISELQLAIKNKHCSNSINQGNCNEVDVSGLIASTCNRRSVCTVNPALVVDQLRNQHEMQIQSKRTVNHSALVFGANNYAVDLMACLKANLYLEYTCAHETLLRPTDTPVLKSNFNIDKRKPNKLFTSAAKFGGRNHMALSSKSVGTYTKNMVTPWNNVGQESKSGDTSTQTNPIDSETNADGSNVLLISLIPSVVCVLLVFVFVTYIAYTKLSSREKYDRGKLTPLYTEDKALAISKSPKESAAMNLGTAIVEPPAQANMNCSVQATNNSRFLVNLKDCHLPWNQPDSKDDSSSVIGSICCECSQTEGEPVTNEPRFTRDMTVNCLLNGSHCSNYVNSVNSQISGNRANKGHMVDCNPSIVRQCHLCSTKSSTVAINNSALPEQTNNVSNHNAVASDDGVNLFKSSDQTSFYSSYPAKYRSPTQSEVVPCLTDTSKNWMRFTYAQPTTTTTVAHTTTTSHMSSPMTPRSITHRAVLSGKQDLYQSIIRSNSQNAQSALKFGDSRPRLKLAPPLFNSTENFVRSVSESYQPNHLFKLRLNKIPVVRYPHDVDEDSEDNSHSADENNTNVPARDLGVTIQNNRPDLCPPMTTEDKRINLAEQTDNESLTNLALSHLHKRNEYNNANSVHGSILDKSATEQSDSPDYSHVGEFKRTADNVSPRPYPRLFANVPAHLEHTDSYSSPKVSKHLRFQAPILELPCAVYDRNNLPPACDMPSSMYRSMQP